MSAINISDKNESRVYAIMAGVSGPNVSSPPSADPVCFGRHAPKGRLIGIDVGTKTLGLALSDATRMVASPLETIKRRKFSVDVLRLSDLADTHQIAGWVVGLPLNMDGSEGPRAQATRAFANNLTAKSPLPILLWDERLSTVAAERSLLEADASRRRRSAVVDKVAASIILQGALDRLRNL